MTTVEILRAAKALIDTPEKWTQGKYARDAEGHALDHSKDGFAGAVCYCAVGALWAAAGSFDEAAVSRVRDAAGTHILHPWNDDPERTHPEVMAAFDRAIAAAEASA